MTDDLTAAIAETLAERLTMGVLHHYGYTDDDIAAADLIHPGRVCSEECYDEDGETIHPPVYDELWLTSALMVDVVVPEVEAALKAHTDEAVEAARAEVVAAVEAMYPPYNYELRYDGSEDPTAAAYVEGFREVDAALEQFRNRTTTATEESR